MKTNVEKQVAAFDKVLGHCNALGTMYNPSTESIKIAALISVLTSAQASIKAVDTAKSDLINAINERQKVFLPIAGIGTRVLNALQATDASPQLIADIKLYRDKFRSKSKPSSKPAADTTQPTQPDASRGPLSQLDFESKIRNFGTMIGVLSKHAGYAPNEADISIEALTTQLQSMVDTNKAVRDAQVTLANARVARQIAVYGQNGISSTGKRVKKYFVTVFGATSEHAKQLNRISFKSR